MLNGCKAHWDFSGFESGLGYLISVEGQSPGNQDVSGCVCALSCFSRVWHCVTFWTVAHQALLSMGLSRQDYWSELPCLPPGDLPNSRVKHMSLKSPALAGRFFTTSTTWEAHDHSMRHDKICLIKILCDIPWGIWAGGGAQTIIVLNKMMILKAHQVSLLALGRGWRMGKGLVRTHLDWVSGLSCGVGLLFLHSMLTLGAYDLLAGKVPSVCLYSKHLSSNLLHGSN